MTDDQVPEVAPVQVSQKKALRLFVGRWIVDYVETFSGIIAPAVAIIVLSPPNSIEGWKVALIQFVSPALAAFVSAGRRAWPQIKKWLAPDE